MTSLKYAAAALTTAVTLLFAACGGGSGCTPGSARGGGTVTCNSNGNNGGTGGKTGGTGGTLGTPVAFVFAKANSTSGTGTSLQAFAVDGSGNTGAVSGFNEIPISGMQLFGGLLVADQSPKLLYEFFGNNQIATFTIGSGGTLTEVAGSPFAIPDFSGTIDPQGQFLFMGQAGNGPVTVAVYSIAPTGGLTQISGSPFPDSQTPITLETAVNGTFLYTFGSAQPGSFPFEGYSVDRNTGALSVLAGSPFDLGVEFPTSATGQFVVGNSKQQTTGGTLTDATLHVFKIDPITGNFTEVVGSPFATPKAVFEVFMDPAGKFAYGIDQSGTIQGYTVDQATGALTAMSGSPFASLPKVFIGSCNPGHELEIAEKSDIMAYCTTSGIQFATINTSTGVPTAAGTPVGGTVLTWALTDAP